MIAHILFALRAMRALFILTNKTDGGIEWEKEWALPWFIVFNVRYYVCHVWVYTYNFVSDLFFFSLLFIYNSSFVFLFHKKKICVFIIPAQFVAFVASFHMCRVDFVSNELRVRCTCVWRTKFILTVISPFFKQKN